MIKLFSLILIAIFILRRDTAKTVKPCSNTYERISFSTEVDNELYESLAFDICCCHIDSASAHTHCLIYFLKSSARAGLKPWDAHYTHQILFRKDYFYRLCDWPLKSQRLNSKRPALANLAALANGDHCKRCALYTPFIACKPLISLKFLQTQKTWPAASLPALSCERGAHYTHPTQSHKPLEALFLQFLLNHFKRLKNTLRWATLKHKQGD